MKKIYLILVVILGLITVTTKAQMSSYLFTPSSGTFTPVTGGTAVATSVSASDFLGDFRTSVSIPLGFNFKFNGVNYSSVIAMSDGFLSFNPSATTAGTNNLSTSTNRPLVAPLWDDLDGNSGSGAATYLTTGSAGSRIFTIEWLNWQWNWNATGATISFQVKLYEGSNAIEFIYRSESGALNSPTASIGIAAIGTGSGNFISLNNSTAAPTASTTTETTSINLKPATGQVYRFEPNPVPEVMDYANLQFPQTATIALGGSETIYTQGYKLGVTEAAGAGTGVQAWIGINGANTDPATWTTWIPATFNVNVGNNDEFQANIGSTLGAGTYYYASRWQLNTGEYRYGGYPNGFWNGTSQTSGVLTVTAAVANDVCSGATPLTVNADLACGVTTAGTTVGATQSPDLPSPTCSATGINDDVWYSFVATGTSHVVTLTAATTTTAAQVYGGSCGNLTAIVCGSTTSGTANITAQGLVGGSTYYVRVYSTSSTVGTTTNFNICIGTPPVPPVNDNCSNATALTVNADLACGVATAGTTLSATQSAETPAPTCSATGINDDVWYSFVATNAFHTINITGATNATAAQVYSGTCGSLATVACGSTISGTANVSANGLTIGNTYLVRVYTTSTTVGTSSNFTICVGTPPPPPANDEICGAISLAVSSDLTCVTSLTGQSTQFAFQSLVACLGTADEDIWYSFVATSTAHIITISNSGSGSTDRVHQLFSSSDNTCNGTLTSIRCSDPETSTNSGLTIGNTYFIRVHSWGSGNFATFDICITTPPAPPANDDCSNATALTVNADLACAVSTTGTTLSATQSAETPAPTCSATGINDDVWFSFVATDASHAINITGATNTTAAQVYSGTCGSLATVVCGSTVSGTANITATGLTSGNTYLVRVYTTSSTVGTSSNFTICIGTPPPPPANDDCSNATVLTVNADLACAVATSGTTLSATQSSETPAPTCNASGINDDVWYSFEATETSHLINITGATNITAAQVYSGTCGSLATVVCGSTSSGTANIIANGLTSGNTYLVRVYTTSTTVGTSSNFTICIGTPPPPPANDECSNATALTVNADLACAVTTSGTTISATQSSETPAPTCSATGINDDVWYSFVATEAIHVINITGATNTTAAQVYSGTCGSLATVVCGSTSSGTANVTATGLTSGNTYLVRVYSTSTTVGTSSNFTICIGTPPPPPANDDCLNATVLTVNADLACAVTTSGTTQSATQSAETPAPTCSATGINDDVWYSFVATGSGHLVNITGATNTTAVQVYSGSCGSLATVVCGSTSSGTANVTATGLTSGNTYLVRVYTTSTTVGTSSNFTICVGTLPPPPANDECANAIVISSTPVSSSTISATQSQAPTLCGSFTSTNANDVWFQFTALSSGAATVTLSNAAGGLDAVIQAYSGSCGTLTNIGCADATGSNSTEVATLNTLTAGQTYFIQVYGYSSSRGSFDITVTGAALPISVEYFRGSKQTNGNLLDWKVTCYNSPTVKMEVERSADGRKFNTIQTQTETALRCLQPFSFADTDPLAGINYYRLKSTDVDGKITYSATVAILNKTKGFEIVSMIPNPVETSAILSISSAVKATMEIVVTDLAGKQLSKQRVVLIAGSNQIPLNLSKLTAGTYQVTGITDEGERKSVRFVKQ